MNKRGKRVWWHGLNKIGMGFIRLLHKYYHLLRHSQVSTNPTCTINDLQVWRRPSTLLRSYGEVLWISSEHPNTRELDIDRTETLSPVLQVRIARMITVVKCMAFFPCKMDSNSR